VSNHSEHKLVCTASQDYAARVTLGAALIVQNFERQICRCGQDVILAVRLLDAKVHYKRLAAPNGWRPSGKIVTEF
jgi:hypothetical protein